MQKSDAFLIERENDTIEIKSFYLRIFDKKKLEDFIVEYYAWNFQ